MNLCHHQFNQQSHVLPCSVSGGWMQEKYCWKYCSNCRNALAKS